MALEPCEEGWIWYHVPREGVGVVVIVSEIHTWWSHWVRLGPRRLPTGVRCQQAERGECALCDRGYDRRARYVLAVEVEGQPRLVEFGRAQYSSLAALEAMGSVVGARVKLGRETRGRTGVITLTPYGMDGGAWRRLRDIGPWVANQGQREWAAWRAEERRRVSGVDQEEEQHLGPTLRFG